MTTEDPQGSEPVPSRMTQTSEENVYHGQGTLRWRRGSHAGLGLEGADGCGGRTGELVRTAVPTAATAAQTVKAAVAVAMNAEPLASVEPFLQPWSGTAVTNLTGTPSLVTITVSGPGASGLSAAQTKPSVQELAWTAGRSRPRGCSRS